MEREEQLLGGDLGGAGNPAGGGEESKGHLFSAAMIDDIGKSVGRGGCTSPFVPRTVLDCSDF